MRVGEAPRKGVRPPLRDLTCRERNLPWAHTKIDQNGLEDKRVVAAVREHGCAC